jgi:hypothetical protein
MGILEQVDQLKAQAVELLLAERKRIDAQLAILQGEKKPASKRGRPARLRESSQPDQLYSSESTQS